MKFDRNDANIRVVDQRIGAVEKIMSSPLTRWPSSASPNIVAWSLTGWCRVKT